MTQERTFAGIEAVRLARLGFSVFPLQSADPASGCSCRRGKACSRPGKHPIMKGGFYKASSSLLGVTASFSRFRNPNVGLRTGNGLGVLDIDVGKGGYESICALVAEHGDLAPSWSVTTGSGGLHIYFRIPENVRNSAGRIGKGVDFRGDGGFVVAAGSAHVSGGTYSWVKGRSPADIPLVDIPEWLLEICRKKPVRHDRAGHSHDFDGTMSVDPSDGEEKIIEAPAAWLMRAFENTLNEIANAPEGTRNNTLYMRAISMGRLIGGGALPFDEVREEMFQAALQSGLEEDEIASTLSNGLKFGASHPKRIFFMEAGAKGRLFSFETETGVLEYGTDPLRESPDEDPVGVSGRGSDPSKNPIPKSASAGEPTCKP